jgi:hypothetical protein
VVSKNWTNVPSFSGVQTTGRFEVEDFAKNIREATDLEEN